MTSTGMISTTTAGRPETVGRRYNKWCLDAQPHLAPAQKAKAHETFAAEFASLAPDEEPYPGWGTTMARLSLRIARRHRGEPLDG